MSTIKLSTAYQLVMTSLLLGAVLGIVAQQLPLTVSTFVPSVRAMVLEESPMVTKAAQSNQPNGIDTDLAVTAIVGHNTQTDLWLVCCQQNQLIWVSKQVISTLRDTVDSTRIEDEAYLSDGLVAIPPVAADIPAVDQRHSQTSRETVALPTPTYAYTLVQMQQYSEQVTPRIYLYVSEFARAERQDGIANLALRIKKDGVPLTTTARTHGGRPEFTWPIAHERQHLANLKLEFPDIEAAGLWEIQLIDANDLAVGPPVQIRFSANELNREIYLHYSAVGQR